MSAGGGGPTVRAVLADLTRRPGHYVVARWNWKAALTSAVMRGLVFYAATRGAGLDAARAALAVEFAYRAASSGCFAALTQAFRHASPGWAAAVVVTLAVPAVAHVLEFAVHCLAGTVELDRGMAASVVFTVVSAAFTLFAMRRGAFIVGDSDRQSFLRDLAALPALIAAFVAAVGRGAWRGMTRLGAPGAKGGRA